MFPDWLIGMFRHFPCTACRNLVTLSDLTFIGASQPEGVEVHTAQAVVVLLVKCPHCQKVINCRAQRPKEALMDAIAAFVDEIESTPAPPSIFTPRPAPQIGRSPGNDIEKGKIRPSIRPGQIMTPPTQEELANFWLELSDNTFKTNSKQYKKFTRGPKKRRNDESK
jgi:hypothetical protein